MNELQRQFNKRTLWWLMKAANHEPLPNTGYLIRRPRPVTLDGRAAVVATDGYRLHGVWEPDTTLARRGVNDARVQRTVSTLWQHMRSPELTTTVDFDRNNLRLLRQYIADLDDEFWPRCELHFKAGFLEVFGGFSIGEGLVASFLCQHTGSPVTRYVNPVLFNDALWAMNKPRVTVTVYTDALRFDDGRHFAVISPMTSPTITRFHTR